MLTQQWAKPHALLLHHTNPPPPPPISCPNSTALHTQVHPPLNDPHYHQHMLRQGNAVWDVTLPWDWWRWTRRSAWWPRHSGPPWPAPPAGNWTWGVPAAGRTHGSCWGQTNPVRRWGNWQSVLWGMVELVSDRSPWWSHKPCQVRKLTINSVRNGRPRYW